MTTTRLLLEQASVDPNWFSSSLAQSAAAVVGVLSAVLATQLQHWLSQADEDARQGAVALKNFTAWLLQDLASLRSYLVHTPAQIKMLEKVISSGHVGSLSCPIIYAPFTTNEPATVGQPAVQLEFRSSSSCERRSACSFP